MFTLLVDKNSEAQVFHARNCEDNVVAIVDLSVVLHLIKSSDAVPL